MWFSAKNDRGFLLQIVLCLTAGFSLSCLAPRCFASEQPAAFSYESLRTKARELAAADYRPENSPELPDQLKKLSYDAYQSIRFVHSEGPWQNGPGSIHR
jgi:glucans biosynthesis protein